MNIESVKGLVEVLNGDARNAMHSILGYLELVAEGTLGSRQREYVEACRGAADRHCRGIEDMCLVLGLTPEERQVPTQFAPADLLARVVKVIGVNARRKRVGLFCEVAASIPPIVSADVDQIGHTYLRIAEGVVGAIDGGDVHLSLRALASPGGSDLTFEIAFARTLPAVLTRALEQDDFEFTASLAGSGALGMAAARKLVAVLGGRVEISANMLTGSRISVTLPVEVPSNATTAPRRDARVTLEAQRPLRILVVEDSEDNFELFKAYLQGQPHILSHASNGAEGVALAAQGIFDLLFMDICMPIMDGYAATRRIRELETGKDRPRVPIVVLSAHDLREQRRQGALVGCSSYLSKPLRKNELLAAIRVYSMGKSYPAVLPVSL